MINMHMKGPRAGTAKLFQAFFSLTVIGWFYLVCREIIQFRHIGRKYFKNKANWLDLFIVIFTLATYLTSTISQDKDTVLILSSWAVFLGWINVISLLGELPLIGQYIYLLSRITTHLFRFIILYLPFLIAFGLKFHLSLHQQWSY